MIFVILVDNDAGKVGSATTFLTARWGSVVMRHMLRFSDLFNEWGTGILLGFNRFLSTMCCLVDRLSQMGWSSSPVSSSSEFSFSVVSRLRLVEVVSLNLFVSVWMCARSARDAFSVYYKLVWGFVAIWTNTYLIRIKFVGGFCHIVYYHSSRFYCHLDLLYQSRKLVWLNCNFSTGSAPKFCFISPNREADPGWTKPEPEQWRDLIGDHIRGITCNITQFTSSVYDIRQVNVSDTWSCDVSWPINQYRIWKNFEPYVDLWL